MAAAGLPSCPQGPRRGLVEDDGRVKVTPVAGEPAVGRWERATVQELLELVRDVASRSGDGPLVVAVDGRSAGGKSTLAAALQRQAAASAVVHTDDVAWHHAFFDWADLLREGVLAAARRGEAVRYRPPAWDERGRAGSIDVPAGTDLLLVEGVGAGRRGLADVLDAVVWVQSDAAEAERRGIARDVASGENGDAAQTAEFWREWAAQEEPFLAADRPWERSCAVVLGTPPPGLAAGEVLLARSGWLSASASS